MRTQQFIVFSMVLMLSTTQIQAQWITNGSISNYFTQLDNTSALPANWVKSAGIGYFGAGYTNSLLHVNSNAPYILPQNGSITNAGEVFRTDGPAGVTHAWRMLSKNGTSGEKFNISNPSGTNNIHFTGIQAGNMNFFTNNIQRATITSTGLVGIGAVNPSNQLHVNGNTLSNVFRTDNDAGVAPIWSMYKGHMNVGNLYGDPGTGQNFNIEANMADLYFWAMGSNAGVNNGLQYRMVISNGNQVNQTNAVIVPNVTRVGINYNPAIPNAIPKTALHIGDPMATGSGYRTWMDLGTVYNNGDHMYTGLKLEGSNRYDAVINWGNDLGAVGQNDFLRFIFSQNTPLGNASQSYNGEEVARFAPNGNCGLGNFFLNGMNTIPNRRLELLDANPNSLTMTNQNQPQLRLTYTFNQNVADGVWTDFHTEASGNLHINVSHNLAQGNVGINNGTAPLTRTLDVYGNLRLRTLPLPVFNANASTSINRVMVCNNDGEVFWRDDIGPGISTTDNGLSINPNSKNVQLGQPIGAIGNPAKLLHHCEIPFNNNNINFVDIGIPNGLNNRMGVGTNNPQARLHVISSNLSNLSGSHSAGQFSNSNGSNASGDGIGIGIGSTGDNKNNHGLNIVVSGAIGDNIGIYSEANSSLGTNIGGYFVGNALNSLGNSYGIQGYAYGTANTISYGVYGNCQAPSNCNNGFVNCPVAAGYFSGDLFHSGGIFTSSDSLFKFNINNFPNALYLVSNLNPKIFEYDKQNYPSLNLANGSHYGLIAQEVELILPGLVKSFREPELLDTNGLVHYPEIEFKSVNYVELIPILIQSIKEQQLQIDDLQNQILNCCALNSSEQKINMKVTLANTYTIILDQNNPNPFAEETNISYTIPETVQKAVILFYDAKGTVLKEVDIKEKGEGSIHVYAPDLSSGIYTYTLIADGKVINSKKMMKK